MEEKWWEIMIRNRTDADVPACADLLRQVFAIDGYPVEGVADAEGWMYPEGLLSAWVATKNDEILGHTAVCKPQSGDASAEMLVARSKVQRSEIAVLARLFVGPNARGAGLGQRLAAVALEYASENNLHAVFDVMEKDQAAIRIYDNLGCVLLGRTSHHVPDGRVFSALCYAAPGTVLDR